MIDSPGQEGTPEMKRIGRRARVKVSTDRPPAAALRELVLQVPAPVAAAALGFHHTTTQRQRTAGGGTWSRYAAR
jgi:hypothetical protein